MLNFVFIFSFYLTMCLSETDGKIVQHVFEVSYFSGAPDGVYKENILGINGQFPGPLIEADLGDVLQIQLINSIQDGQNTSIHWHGIHQKGSSFEDGTSQVSQCPLRNGHTQQYEFTLNQPGTYWYHSHVNSQYTEGLWGTLVVHNKPEVYSYDEEIVITVNDWYHQTARENEEWHLSPESKGIPPYPNSGMINGIGRYNCRYPRHGNRTCDPTLQKRPVFILQPHKTYRIRLINTSAVSAFNFSIDGHRLEVIEVDGTDVAPSVPVDIIPIAAGQRYSFLIKTNASSDRHLIRANLRTESLVPRDGNINLHLEALMPNVTAVLEYVLDTKHNSPLVFIGTEIFSYLDEVPEMLIADPVTLNENDLSPSDGNFAPAVVNQEIFLEITFDEDDEDIRRGSFNYTPFRLPDGKPLLMTLLDGEPIPDTVFPVYIEHMEVIQIVINNSFARPHPLHLHGHNFWVMGIGPWHDGAYDPSKHELILTGARRDTVLVEEYSWVVIRFIADNPGIWTFHCHIDWHNLSGMSLTFVEAKEMAQSNIVVTKEALRVCGIE